MANGKKERNNLFMTHKVKRKRLTPRQGILSKDVKELEEIVRLIMETTFYEEVVENVSDKIH